MEAIAFSAQPRLTSFAPASSLLIDLDKDSGIGLNFGIPVVQGPFQNLTDPQKYTVLIDVTRQLLTETPVSDQTAISEGAVYYVYCWLKQQFSDVYHGVEVWGDLILKVVAEDEEKGDGEDDYFPTLDCYDMEKWDSAIEWIADRILWDRDWEMASQFPAIKGNFSPLMRYMSIQPDYFAPFQGRAKPHARERLLDLINNLKPNL